MGKKALDLQATTLWDYESRNYPGSSQGDTAYAGATPSYVVWNLLGRYTQPGDLVVDPMAGSGTTVDVARQMERRGLGYDIAPASKTVFRADARRLPLEDGKADFVFVDPPYGDHIKYSDLPQCIGKLRADSEEYYREMGHVAREIARILRPGKTMAMYVCDSFKKGRPFMPIGFRMFEMLSKHFTPVDVVAVVRHNATLKDQRYRQAAIDGGFFLRGFNYLLIFRKEPRATAQPRSMRRGRLKHPA